MEKKKKQISNEDLNEVAGGVPPTSYEPISVPDPENPEKPVIIKIRKDEIR